MSLFSKICMALKIPTSLPISSKHCATTAAVSTQNAKVAVLKRAVKKPVTHCITLSALWNVLPLLTGQLLWSSLFWTTTITILYNAHWVSHLVWLLQSCIWSIQTSSQCIKINSQYDYADTRVHEKKTTFKNADFFKCLLKPLTDGARQSPGLGTASSATAGTTVNQQ